jgi:hypothetical protein
MENISNIKLKKALSSIKKDINSKLGPIWKLDKPKLINKLKQLNYKYDSNKKILYTDSMIRKPRKIYL